MTKCGKIEKRDASALHGEHMIDEATAESAQAFLCRDVCMDTRTHTASKWETLCEQLIHR